MTALKPRSRVGTMIPAVHSFSADADITGYHGSFPIIRLICKECGRPLYGDWQYNFTDQEAHAGCAQDGVLHVQAQVDGLLVRAA